MSPKKYLAEFIGTLLLTFMVSSSIVFDLPVATPVIAGLAVMIIVYMIGGISGAHLNPAVTVSLWTAKKINSMDAVMYIVVQFIGAVAAMGIIAGLDGSVLSVGASNEIAVGVAEAIGAFVLLFGISAVVWKKAPEAASGLTIGGSLLLGILAAAGVSNGVLNPAVAVGIGSVSWMYMLAPIVGAILAVWTYKYISE